MESQVSGLEGFPGLSRGRNSVFVNGFNNFGFFSLMLLAVLVWVLGFGND